MINTNQPIFSSEHTKQLSSTIKLPERPHRFVSQHHTRLLKGIQVPKKGDCQV